MEKEYEVNSRKQKKAWKKYRKAFIRLAIFVGLAVFGLMIPGATIVDLIAKLGFLTGETLTFVAILCKSSLMLGGGAIALMNGLKAHFVGKEIRQLEDEEIEIIEYLEKINNSLEAKNRNLTNELKEEKEKNEELTKKKTRKVKEAKKEEETVALDEKSEDSLHKIKK